MSVQLLCNLILVLISFLPYILGACTDLHGCLLYGNRAGPSCCDQIVSLHPESVNHKRAAFPAKKPHFLLSYPCAPFFVNICAVPLGQGLFEGRLLLSLLHNRCHFCLCLQNGDPPVI